MDRRDFIKKLGVSAAAASVLSPGFVFADERKRTEGKRLYTYPDMTADVVVAGAGPSGIPAAIAAARAGARVILLEQDAMPGGAPDLHALRRSPRRDLQGDGSDTEQ